MFLNVTTELYGQAVATPQAALVASLNTPELSVHTNIVPSDFKLALTQNAEAAEFATIADAPAVPMSAYREAVEAAMFPLQSAEVPVTQVPNPTYDAEFES